MRARLTYSNVASTLCLFLLLTGGAAYAASHLGKNSVGAKQLKKNSVGAKQLKKNSVTTAKVRKGAVTAAKLKNGAATAAKIAAGAVGTGALQDRAVSSAKIADNAVGGAQADEASFQNLVHGEGTQLSNAVSVSAEGFIEPARVLADIPGFGQVRLFYCGEYADNDKVDVQILNEGAPEFVSVGSVHGAALPGGTTQAEFYDFAGGRLLPETGEFLVGHPGGPIGLFGSVDKFDWMLFRGEGPNAAVAHVSISALNDSNSSTHKGHCTVAAETLVQP
jgi:hypothetical protein